MKDWTSRPSDNTLGPSSTFSIRRANLIQPIRSESIGHFNDDRVWRFCGATRRYSPTIRSRGTSATGSRQRAAAAHRCVQTPRLSASLTVRRRSGVIPVSLHPARDTARLSRGWRDAERSITEWNLSGPIPAVREALVAGATGCAETEASS
jgi:hypothetical protein